MRVSCLFPCSPVSFFVSFVGYMNTFGPHFVASYCRLVPGTVGLSRCILGPSANPQCDKRTWNKHFHWVIFDLVLF